METFLNHYVIRTHSCVFQPPWRHDQTATGVEIAGHNRILRMQITPGKKFKHGVKCFSWCVCCNLGPGQDGGSQKIAPAPCKLRLGTSLRLLYFAAIVCVVAANIRIACVKWKIMRACCVSDKLVVSFKPVVFQTNLWLVSSLLCFRQTCG